MADQQAMEPLAFNFASRIIAYRRLAQKHSPSLSTTSTFNLDAVVKADQCAQYIEDIGIAANAPQQMTKNSTAVFQRLTNADLKLTIANCHFEVQELDFVGCTLTTKGVAPQKQKYSMLLQTSKFRDPENHCSATMDF